MQKATLGRVYVWEIPVRFYHWVNALSLVILCVTGYLIGAPLAMAEMKVFLSLLARRYHFSIADADAIQWTTIPLAVPKCGLPLTLAAR